MHLKYKNPDILDKAMFLYT